MSDDLQASFVPCEVFAIEAPHEALRRGPEHDRAWLAHLQDILPTLEGNRRDEVAVEIERTKERLAPHDSVKHVNNGHLGIL